MCTLIRKTGYGVFKISWSDHYVEIRGGGEQGGYKKNQLANKIIDIWKTSYITQCDGDNKKMRIEMYIEIIIVLCIKCAMGHIQTV